MEPFFSFIVPVYNAEEYINQCVNSLIEQTYKDREIILVTDGSQDNSGAICDSYAAKYEFIHVIHKRNSGVSQARNTGIEIACGKYLIFVDSDDWVSDNFCERAIQILVNDEYDLLLMKHNIYSNNCFFSVRVNLNNISSLQDITNYFDDLFDAGILNSPCSKCYKRACIYSRFDSNISVGEDLLFNLEFLKACESILCIDEVVYHYRIEKSSSSLTNKYRPNGLFEVDNLYNKTLKACTDIWKDICLGAVERRYINDVLTNIEKILLLSKEGGREYERIYQFWAENKLHEIYVKNKQKLVIKKRIEADLVERNKISLIKVMLKFKNKIRYIMGKR
jgi:glycosyltransferase involved in cell wall biosynthesis